MKREKDSRWQRFRRALGTFSLSGFLYFLFLRLRGREILVGGVCHSCGRCCQSICLHDGENWLRQRDGFLRLVASCPEFSRFEIIDTDAQGFLVFRCTLCTPEGICSEYENRLALCRSFPEKSLQFCGGALPAGCGYFFQEVVPFTKILEKELRYQREKR